MNEMMPHPLNRKGQQEAYDKVNQSDKQHVIIQAPTGLGKSALCAQDSYDNDRSLYLCKTKSLQNQMKNSYDFEDFKGKATYPCGIDVVVGTDICHSSDYDKEYCRDNCPYYIARDKALNSPRASLNYAKFLTERYEGGFVGQYYPGATMWLDEAHELSDIVCGYAGFQLSQEKISEFMSPEIGGRMPVSLAVSFLSKFKSCLPNLKVNKKSTKKEIREYRKVENLKMKIEVTLSMIQAGIDDWYASSDEDNFTLKPLTAKYHFSKFFNYEKIVMMSATIGNPSLFAGELGLPDYHFINVSQLYPAPMRRIVDMKCPKMSYNSTEADRSRQVEIIANQINQLPGDWRGIILTNSKAQARNMQRRLFELIDRPIWIPNEKHSTDYMYQGWLNQPRSAVACTWSFWEGVDLGCDQFVIVAKIPFPSFADGYDKARFDYNPKAALQRVANKLVQGLGRVRRGHLEHYGSAKFVGIADGNWIRVKNFINKEILEAIY